MIEKRVKCGLAIAPSVLKLCDVNIKLAKVVSRNDFVEQAIKFYAGYLNAEINPDFFDKIFIGQAEKAVKEMGTALARGEYKIAVELAKLSYIIAEDKGYTRSQLEELDEKSRNEVLHMKGTLRLNDIMK